MTMTRKIVSTILLIGALGLVAACEATFRYPVVSQGWWKIGELA